MNLSQNPLVDPGKPQDRRLGVVVLTAAAVVVLTLFMLAFAGQPTSADMRDSAPPQATAAATALEVIPTLPPEVDTTPSEQDQELNRYAAHGG